MARRRRRKRVLTENLVLRPFAERDEAAFIAGLANFDLAPDEFPANYQLLEVDCASIGVLSLDDNQLGKQWAEQVIPRRASAASGWLPACPPC